MSNPPTIDLPDDARVVLCDVWGCLHDGRAAFPDAMAALARWRAEGRIVILVTNAPRPAAAVERQIARIGVMRDCYDMIVTSGDVGLDLVGRRDERCALIGTRHDRETLAEAGFRPTADGDEPIVVCAGLDDERRAVEDYDGELRAMRERGALLACFNPDRVVLHDGEMTVCAGALGDRYAAMGGEVLFTGKPFAPIYERALGLASAQAGRDFGPADAVAIGDAVATDLAGAAGLGIRFLFVTEGIERHEIAEKGVDALIARARADHDLHDFAPLAVIDALR